MKLLITGGHVTPALAVIDKLQKLKDVEIVFVGRKYTLDREKTHSLEYQEVTGRNIRFIELKTGRLTRVIALRSLVNLLKFIPGLFRSAQIIFQEKPQIILSFGGYLALPIAITGFLRGIPVYTHEQTIHPGLANKIISRFATKVFVAFEETEQYFDKKKTITTGNPVRDAVKKVIDPPFTVSPHRPVIYITGGSLGAHAINTHILAILEELLSTFTLIHQTGDVKQYSDYEKLTQARENLPESLQHNYFIAKNFFEDQIGYIYKVADIVISRAGANTFFELIALEKPAILIPLPWSGSGEQQKHAKIFKEYGLGEIFQQEMPSSDLLSLIKKVYTDRDTYVGNFTHLKKLIKEDAAQTIIDEIMGDQKQI